MSAPEQDDLDIVAARTGKARLSPTPSPSSAGGVHHHPQQHPQHQHQQQQRDPSVSPSYSFVAKPSDAFPYPSPPPAVVGASFYSSSGGSGGGGKDASLSFSPDSASSTGSGHSSSGSTRGMAPINVSRVAASNSELRNRASPIGRPTTSAAHAAYQQMHPSPLVGIHSRAHMSAGGHTPLRSEREDVALHARKHSDSFRPGGAHYPGPVGSALLGTSRRRGLLVPLLCFVGGMVLMYIVLTGSLLTLEGELQQQPHAETAAMPASALTVGALLARGKTPAQLQAELRSSLPICGAHNYGDGEWVYDESITRAPYVSHEWDNVCDAGRETNEDGSIKHIREELKWVWQPRHCRLVPYSRRHFCELLADRNILFAGDSIAGQHVSSFVHLMSDKPDNLWVRDEYFRHDLMTVCQDVYPVLPGESEAPAGRDLATSKPLPGVRVGFKRNNFLSLHRQVNRSEEYRKWNTSQAWIQEVGGATATPEGHKGPAYDIIVINTGIWMVDAPIYERMLRDISSALASEYPGVTVLWRSTQPGHADCHSHWSRPQKCLYSIADTTGGSARFRWEEAEERNRIAQTLFPEAYFDVWNLTRLRPDGHMPGECLHYCQPGPVDEWHKLLYHRLAIKNPTFVRKVLAEQAAEAHQAAIETAEVEHRAQQQQQQQQLPVTTQSNLPVVLTEVFAPASAVSASAAAPSIPTIPTASVVASAAAKSTDVPTLAAASNPASEAASAQQLPATPSPAAAKS